MWITRAGVRLRPQLRAAPRADVIAISSSIVDQMPAGGGAYSMAKAALEAAARTLAAEERPYGIRVNTVAPGPVATDMGERLVAATARTTLAQLDERHPFGRVARPEDVAAVVAFLASPARPTSPGSGSRSTAAARRPAERPGAATGPAPRRPPTRAASRP